MFVDASALTAMLTDESDAAELLARLQNHSDRTTSPLAIWETVIAVSRILGLSLSYAHVAVEEYLKLMSIRVTDVPADAHILAMEAFERFGKGRHPAALNFGDCFAYAMARQSRAPLLYKGGDFAQTDIEAA